MGHFQAAKGDQNTPDVDQDGGDGDERNHAKQVEKARGVAQGDSAQGLAERALAASRTGKQVANETKKEPMANQAEGGRCQRQESESDAVVAAVGKQEGPGGAQRAFYLEQGFAAWGALSQALQQRIQEGIRGRQRCGQEETAKELGDGDQDADTGAQEKSLNPGIVVIDHFYEWVGFQKEGLPDEPRVVLWL